MALRDYGYDPYADTGGLYDDRALPRAKHILRFRLEKNFLTGQMVWRVFVGGTLYEVSLTAKNQPTSNDEVWLCQEAENAGQTETDRRLVPVEPMSLLFNGQQAFRFTADLKRLFAGKPCMKAYLPHHDLNIWCVPDKDGESQPTDGHEFWFCQFTRVVVLDYDKGYLLVAVKLLREDTEARDRHLAKEAELEVIRQQNEKDAATRAEASSKEWAIMRAKWQQESVRQSAVDVAKEELARQFPTIAAKQQQSRLQERLMGVSTSVVSTLPSPDRKRRKTVMRSW